MMDLLAEPKLKRPFRRRVFYVPGYDPFHPRRYRELYRRHGAAQAEISGYALTLKPRTTPGPFGWHVSAGMEGGFAETDIAVLAWSDIVRDPTGRGILSTYLHLLRTVWIYVATGAAFRLVRLRTGPVLAALYPVLVLLVQLGLAVALGLHLSGIVGGLVWPPLGWLAGGALAVALLRWFRRRDAVFLAHDLMHDFGHSAQSWGATPPRLQERMARFRAAISEAMRDEVDEILVIGHSSGARLAVSIMADLIRGGLPAKRPALALLTLGQVVPMVSFLPRAERLRADLNYLAARDELTWVDVTAPGDACCFALCDPVSVSGVAPEGKRWPLVISAAFSRTLSPERWRALRWRFFRLHFQYLCAFDRPEDYDYFRITAGPLTLAERFRGRAPSRSRIDRAASGYVSMSA
ncbi:hypothetical protein [Cereibacter sphaeroides]|uniref:hypothetical protein n=1 Tax=Cereibacter sphaeroides TaxID=1063 RepID=UPI001F441231|nr:hypothetical protein [Cereibacter sphaeroides]MCE6969137.1 hypothetical protein [Cereibacter sphaeroides]